MTRAETILGLGVRAGRWSAVVTITAEQARMLLEEQPSQRPVNDRHVTMLANEITSGRFELTHQGIAFDTNGLLFDGQHRLWACFNTGVAITVWVFFNEPRDNFAIVDTRSKPRTNGDLAMIKGQFGNARHATHGVTAARFIQAYDRHRNPTQPSPGGAFQSTDVDEVLLDHPGLPEMVRHFVDTTAARRWRLPRSPAIALFTLFSEANSGKAAIFLHQVLTGENLRKGDPALTLRDSAAEGDPTARGRLVELTYRTVRAWNGFVAGRTLARLYGSNAANAAVLRKGGRDTFPEIAGYIRPSDRRAP